MTSKTGVAFRAEHVRFLSEVDEAAFFYWLDRLKDYVSVRGEGDALVFEIAARKLADDQLRELIALCHRYNIDLRHLAVFETRSNRSWLRNKRAFWHDAMYEKESAA